MKLNDVRLVEMNRKEYKRQWYLDNKDRVSEHTKQKRVKQRKEYDIIKQELVDYKGGKCQICGYSDKCLAVYDFHHVEGEKEFQISEMRNRNIKYKILIQEVDKCILVCSNCHRKIHFGDKQ